jgi:hypothetical protein
VYSSAWQHRQKRIQALRPPRPKRQDGRREVDRLVFAGGAAIPPIGKYRSCSTRLSISGYDECLPEQIWIVNILPEFEIRSPFRVHIGNRNQSVSVDR